MRYKSQAVMIVTMVHLPLDTLVMVHPHLIIHHMAFMVISPLHMGVVAVEEVAVVEEEDETIVATMDLPVYPSSSAMSLPTLIPKTYKSPLVASARSVMSTSPETFTVNNPRDLPSLSMPLPKWHGRHERR